MTNFPEFFRYSVLTLVEVLANVRCFCEVFCHEGACGSAVG